MNLTLARKVQLLLVLAIAFVAVVGTAGLLSTRYLGNLIDAYQDESVPSLEALADLATAVGRAAGGASAVENGSLEAEVHRKAIELVASQVQVVEKAAKAFEARKHEGDMAAAWSQLQAPLAAWRTDLDALTESARRRAAHADRFAEAAAMQSQVTEAFEQLRRDAQALLQLQFCLAGPEDQNGFGLPELTDDVIVVPVELLAVALLVFLFAAAVLLAAIAGVGLDC